LDIAGFSRAGRNSVLQAAEKGMIPGEKREVS
jgi:hypothetical protein